LKQLNSEFSIQLKDKIQFQKEEKVSIRQAFELIFLFTTLFLSLPLLDSHTQKYNPNKTYLSLFDASQKYHIYNHITIYLQPQFLFESINKCVANSQPPK